MAMRKKQKQKVVWTVVITVLVLLAIGAVGYGINTMLSAGGDTNGIFSGGTDDAAAVACAGDVTPDLTIVAFDSENQGTAIVQGGLYRKVGSTVWTAFTTGTTIADLEPGVTYDFVPGVNSSIPREFAFGEMFQRAIKCQADETIEIPMSNDELETSLAATFYNNDANAAAQAFAAGDNYLVSVKLKAGSDEFFGNPFVTNPNIIVLKANSTAWKKPLDVYLADGTSLVKADTPEAYDGQASGFVEYAYVLPAVSDKEMLIYFDLEADADPVNDDTLYIFSGSYFVNDNSGISVGVEDDDGNLISNNAADTVTMNYS